eukprot:gene51364-57259_t
MAVLGAAPRMAELLLPLASHLNAEVRGDAARVHELLGRKAAQENTDSYERGAAAAVRGDAAAALRHFAEQRSRPGSQHKAEQQQQQLQAAGPAVSSVAAGSPHIRRWKAYLEYGDNAAPPFRVFDWEAAVAVDRLAQSALSHT